jgi:hypothetical protein
MFSNIVARLLRFVLLAVLIIIPCVAIYFQINYIASLCGDISPGAICVVVILSCMLFFVEICVYSLCISFAWIYIILTACGH